MKKCNFIIALVVLLRVCRYVINPIYTTPERRAQRLRRHGSLHGIPALHFAISLQSSPASVLFVRFPIPSLRSPVPLEQGKPFYLRMILLHAPSADRLAVE
uniref:Putative secreted protein n=1 Tax=Anopheles marajoara TaxID=58244 RepID=A0A2M4C9R3_9DIPT